MGAPILSEPEFVAAWNAAGGSSTAMARSTGMNERAILRRRRRIEEQGKTLVQPHAADWTKPHWAYHRLRTLEFDSGTIIVYSDAHYWPHTPPSKAFRALVRLAAALRPVAIVANGDLIDGAKISRFPASGWARNPSMTDELAEMKERQAEIRAAAPSAKLFRTIGNHDLRLDRFFATNADQFQGMAGTRLSDHLPDWPESWAVKINDTFIKHRFKGGRHADWNNVLHAGCSIVTGHLHNLKYDPIRGYRDRTIYGIETGTLSNHPWDEPEEGGGPFEYGEDSPTHWACGFAVLTFYKGVLLPPEFCQVECGKAWFRGSEVAI